MGNIIKPKCNTNYTVVDNEILKDPTISMGAKGLFCYLQSLPEDWSIRIAELTNHFPNGKAAIRTSVKELEEKGYLLGVDKRGEGGLFLGRDYILYPTSQLGLEPHTENRYTDKRYPVNRTLQKKDTSTSINTSISKKEKIKDIVEFLNIASGSHFKSATKSTIKLIQARMNEGYDYDDFVAVIKVKCSQWAEDRGMKKYLRPETLFGTKFEGYLQESKRIDPPRRKLTREEIDAIGRANVR